MERPVLYELLQALVVILARQADDYLPWKIFLCKNIEPKGMGIEKISGLTTNYFSLMDVKMD